jgi:hypothetical protein
MSLWEMSGKGKKKKKVGGSAEKRPEWRGA